MWHGSGSLGCWDTRVDCNSNLSVCPQSVPQGLRRRWMRYSWGLGAGFTVKETRVNERGQTDGGLDVSSPDGWGLGGHLLPCCASVEASSLPLPPSSQIKLGRVAHCLSVVKEDPLWFWFESGLLPLLHESLSPSPQFNELARCTVQYTLWCQAMKVTLIIYDLNNDGDVKTKYCYYFRQMTLKFECH